MTPADMTPFEALDHVKSLRAGYNACNGSLYKSVAMDQMQTFLEQCIAKWGNRFMDCVKRERDEEIIGSAFSHLLKDKDRRDLIFQNE